MIQEWLQKLKNAWAAHDIEAVMALFSDDVEYWETPFVKVASKEALREEWLAIHEQTNIDIQTTVYSTDNDKFTVLWDLRYDKSAQSHHWAGTYLIGLDNKGMCSYFHQTGEKQ
ncbi:nuclear transport factor 2 family protein [Candidatus Saccharibacteria bacterium]|nr:nuclear transport factor 2 family protein [Candidatus Saccharibacteria bacterium]